MTISLSAMSASDGYRVPGKTVAPQQRRRGLPTLRTKYYTAAGMPPGRWFHNAVVTLGDGQIAIGSQVSEAEFGIPRRQRPRPAHQRSARARPSRLRAACRSLTGQRSACGRRHRGLERSHMREVHDRLTARCDSLPSSAAHRSTSGYAVVGSCSLGSRTGRSIWSTGQVGMVIDQGKGGPRICAGSV